MRDKAKPFHSQPRKRRLRPPRRQNATYPPRGQFWDNMGKFGRQWNCRARRGNPRRRAEPSRSRGSYDLGLLGARPASQKSPQPHGFGAAELARTARLGLSGSIRPAQQLYAGRGGSASARQRFSSRIEEVMPQRRGLTGARSAPEAKARHLRPPRGAHTRAGGSPAGHSTVRKRSSSNAGPSKAATAPGYATSRS